MKTQKILTIAAVAAGLTSGCSLQKEGSDALVKNTQSQVSTIPADQPGVAGVPGALVPVAQGVTARIENTLEGSVTAANSTNFKAAVAQFGANLASTQNPRRATGAGDVAMISYAACADVNQGTVYGVTATTVAAARASLIAAGKRMVDRCTGGLSAQAPYSDQVTAEMTRLVDANAPSATTVKMAFNGVCVAATTFCTQYLGF